ncbi:DUF4397 domain-containing protein [Clostridium niameyense]|uniref:DUF4397 domain-containing protein n=1 Tax=Clostridium niameyense TaxID=1622073 RepID=A0A6M0R9S6_9CLOT|nr:DUF4397 domain-containing protein [Clostridium niameyense]NEZ45958.1 DUF4397 domain-containing protein [Clostridium niameyense]
MFDLPSFDENGVKFRTINDQSYIRILHASPNAPNVDVYINNEPKAKNITYKEFTEYMPLNSGTYNLKVFPTGNTTTPVINENLFFPPKGIYTIAIYGLLEDIGLMPILDKRLDYTNPTKVYVKVIHLSPNTPTIDVYFNDQIAFRNISYENITQYLSIPPNNYTIDLKLAGTNKTILTVPNANLTPNRYYSVYLVGFANRDPGLQLLIPLDGNSYIKF